MKITKDPVLFTITCNEDELREIKEAIDRLRCYHAHYDQTTSYNKITKILEVLELT